MPTERLASGAGVWQIVDMSTEFSWGHMIVACRSLGEFIHLSRTSVQFRRVLCIFVVAKALNTVVPQLGYSHQDYLSPIHRETC